MHNPIQSNNSFGQIHVESRMEIRIISRSVWYHENVQIQDSLIFDKFLIQWRMFKIVLFLLYFTLIVQENSYHSLKQSDKKISPMTIWSPAFSLALQSSVVSPLNSYWILKVLSFPLAKRDRKRSIRYDAMSIIFKFGFFLPRQSLILNPIHSCLTYRWL